MNAAMGTPMGTDHVARLTTRMAPTIAATPPHARRGVMGSFRTMRASRMVDTLDIWLSTAAVEASAHLKPPSQNSIAT